MSKKDPLHIPYERLVVQYGGKEAFMLNKKLLDQQNCWDNLELIRWLHEVRLRLEDKLVKEGPALLGQWAEIQFQLQDAWGFPRDAKFHRFWDMKGCLCPKMDNDDAYPSGFYVRVGNCPIHGGEIDD